MSYMVIYRNNDGEPSYYEVDELAVAASYVEDLRNSKGIERARLVSLQDVDFEFRAYYRVELGEVGATGPSKPVPPPRHVAQATNHDDFVPVPADTQAYEAKPAVWNVGVATDPALPSDLLDGEEVGANVRRGLFGR